MQTLIRVVEFYLVTESHESNTAILAFRDPDQSIHSTTNEPSLRSLALKHGALRVVFTIPVIQAAHFQVVAKAARSRVNRSLDAGVPRHVSEKIDRHLLRPSALIFKNGSERHGAEVAHDEFEKDLAQDRSGWCLLPGQVHRSAAEEHTCVHENRVPNESVDDVVAEAVVAEVVTEDVEPDEGHAADSCIVVVQVDHAICVQALKIELEVGHCCFL